ncbi:MAG: hypothetical protein AABY22_00720, partial [Nanoarchaeota archaeon]
MGKKRLFGRIGLLGLLALQSLLPTQSRAENLERIVAASDSSSESKASANYVCDGINDQVEIQNAINSIGISGGTVKLMDGIYKIPTPPTNLIEVNKSRLHIVGESRDGTILKDNSPPTFRFSSSGGYLENIKISNLTIDGNSSVSNGTGFIYCPGNLGVSNIYLEDLDINVGWASGNMGIYFGIGGSSVPGNGIYIRDNNITGNYKSQYGISIWKFLEDLWIERNLVSLSPITSFNAIEVKDIDKRDMDLI